jgi:hypothetical protein
MSLTIEDIKLIETMMQSVLPPMVSEIIRQEVPPMIREIVHEIVDPRFDAIDEELRRINLVIKDHGVRLNRLEKLNNAHG